MVWFAILRNSVKMCAFIINKYGVLNLQITDLTVDSSFKNIDIVLISACMTN